MGIARNIRTVTEMKTRAAKLLDEVNAAKQPVVITQDGKARAVMMDVESYEDLKNALGILKLAAQGEEDIRAGRWSDQETVFRRIREKLRKSPRHGTRKS